MGAVLRLDSLLAPAAGSTRPEASGKPESMCKAVVTLGVKLDTVEHLDHGERHEDLTHALTLGPGGAPLHSTHVLPTYGRAPRNALLSESWGNRSLPWKGSAEQKERDSA